MVVKGEIIHPMFIIVISDIFLGYLCGDCHVRQQCDSSHEVSYKRKTTGMAWDQRTYIVASVH